MVFIRASENSQNGSFHFLDLPNHSFESERRSGNHALKFSSGSEIPLRKEFKE